MSTADNACTHCGKHDQWISHGYAYKSCADNTNEVVGRRIICAKRYGRTGCGRTRQLYLADVIPKRHYRLCVVIAFIKALLDGALIEQAYLDATGCLAKEARHAWRWLKDFYHQLPRWRTHITRSRETFKVSQRSPCLKTVLPTLACLLNGVIGSPIQAIQPLYQRPFF